MGHVLLALDPSLTAFGWAAVALDDEPKLIGAGVIETKATPKGKRTSVCEDDARRARFIRRELAHVFDCHRPAIVAIEALGGSTNARDAKQLGAAQAIAACVVDAELEHGQAVYVTALEAGTAIGLQPTQRVTKPRRKKGEAAAPVELSKEEARAANKARRERRTERKTAIARAVVERFGARMWRWALDLGVDPGRSPDGLAAELVADSRWEGAYDAAAVALAAWERPEVAAVRRLVLSEASHRFEESYAAAQRAPRSEGCGFDGLRKLITPEGSVG